MCWVSSSTHKSSGQSQFDTFTWPSRAHEFQVTLLLCFGGQPVRGEGFLPPLAVEPSMPQRISVNSMAYIVEYLPEAPRLCQESQ